MERVHNFSAGPAALPPEVLQSCAAEMLNYANTGMSVMEMSHRSSAYRDIIDDAEATLRRLIGADEHFSILFLQGGATLQFAAIPLNLMYKGRASYILSGNWSKAAWQEAQKYGDAQVFASSEASGFSCLPQLPYDESMPDHSLCSTLDQTLDYLYLCQNETVFGTMFHTLPYTGSTSLVADVSSCFLSGPLDLERISLAYAGVQKNAGPAGVTIVIARRDLIANAAARNDICPRYMSYSVQDKHESMLNTPNCWGIYVCGKVFHWIEDQGGLEVMEQKNWAKVQLLYDYLDESSLFHGTAAPSDRSISNVCFRSTSPYLDNAFIDFAAKHNIVNIKGHRLVGGMRASCYNAVPESSVKALISCMHEFESQYR